MIPSYKQFMRPFLEIAKEANGSEVKLRDVINQLADKFNLTDEERAETFSSGKAKAYFEKLDCATIPLFKLNMRIDQFLKQFIFAHADRDYSLTLPGFE